MLEALARIGDDPEQSRILLKAAEDTRNHSRMWARLLEREVRHPRVRFNLGGLMIWVFARIFGMNRAAGLIVLGQKRNVSEYMFIPGAREIIQEKRKITDSLNALATNKGEEDHQHALSRFLSGEGGTLRAAVLGMNDGLVSNFSLVMGVAAGSESVDLVILAGVASLIAGAFSMAAGEYISVRSQRDVYENMIREEKVEIELWPEEEKALLIGKMKERGLTEEEAASVSKRIFQNPEIALDTMIKEELGLNPEDLGSPWGVAISSMAAFSIGALFPLIPFLIVMSDSIFVVLASALVSATALLLVGGILAWMTRVRTAWGSLRMLLVGVFAAAVTFGIGSLIGVAIS